VDIAEWLRGLGLQECKSAFRRNAIDAAVLRDLTADDIRELGVTAIGHRRKLLAAIAALAAARRTPLQRPRRKPPQRPRRKPSPRRPHPWPNGGS
jgi:hypothetical protein